MEHPIYFTLCDERTGKGYSQTLVEGDDLVIGINPTKGTKSLAVVAFPGLLNQAISRNHVRVKVQGSELYAFNEGRNGSYVNGEPAHGFVRTPLTDGDVLGLGLGFADGSSYDFQVKIRQERRGFGRALVNALVGA